VRAPETGLPEVTIIAVSNGWIVYAGRTSPSEGYSFDRVIGAFETFATLAAWLHENIENNAAAAK
jgi:hypothetical protein